MRRFVTLSAIAAAALFASCSKVDDLGASEEIRFKTVNYVTKAVSYANGPFAVSAWYKGTDPNENKDFMDKVQVTGTNASYLAWNPVVTYYWPKSGTIDFLAYSPYDVVPSTFTETSIAYTDLTIGSKDIMYSDKAVGCSAANSAAGVPILFHHLLAKIGIKIMPAYNDIYDESTHTYTHWDMTLSGTFEIENIATQGSVALTPDGTGWAKPANNIWTAKEGSAKTSYKVNVPSQSITDPSYNATILTPTSESPLYIMPQKASGKEIGFTITIKTYRGVGTDLATAKAACDAKIEANTPDLTESNVPISAQIGRTDTDADYWTINSSTVYTLRISPAYNGKIQVPVYIKDADGDGKPDDTDGDGIPDTTKDPNKALKDENGNPTPSVVPVYIKDADGDGVPDDTDGDGIPDTTTDPDKALKTDDPNNPGTKIPVYVKDEDGDGVPDTITVPDTTTDPDKALKVDDPDNPGNEIPVYIKDEDGDGVPDDTDGDGKPDTTTDPDKALKTDDPNNPGNEIPVYVKDEDGDGQPDTKEVPDTTTDPDKALKVKETIEAPADGPVKITFDPAVMSWDAVEQSSTDVQK